MDALLRKYKQNDAHAELELRFMSLDKSQWVEMYARIIELGISPSILRTVEVVDTNTNNRKISSYIYEKGQLKRSSISFMHKQLHNQLKFDNSCKLVLSEETVVNAYKYTQDTPNAIIRIKVRESYLYGDWRLDVTVVHQTSDTSALLDLIKVFFYDYGTNLAQFAATLQHDIKYEIEAEYMGMPQAIVENDITSILSTLRGIKKYNAEIAHIWDNLARPRILTLSLYKYLYMSQNEWYLSAKIDGTTVLMLFDTDGVYMYTSKLDVKLLTDKVKSNKQYIFQGEYISDDVIYIIDVFVNGNMSCVSKPFIVRYKYADEIAKIYPVCKVKKQYFMVNTLPSCIDEILKTKMQDGIIFNKNKPYNYMVIYKWKPSEELTIDFVIIDPHKYGATEYPPNEYHLYSVVTKSIINTYNLSFLPYYKPVYNNNNCLIHFSSFMNRKAYIWHHEKKEEYHESIGEFHYDMATHTWKLKQLRNKAYANNLLAADALYAQQFSPLTVDYLKNPGSVGYFQIIPNDGIQLNQCIFIRYVRGRLYEQLKSKKNVLVLAAGRGQELKLTTQLLASNVVFCDIDIFALQELLDRLYMLRAPYENKEVKQKYPTNHVVQMDLTAAYTQNVAKLVNNTGVEKFDAVTMMLALHYIITSDKSRDNFINFISAITQPYAVVVFLLFDGKMIYEYLKKHGEYKLVTADGVIAYHILPNFKSDTFGYDSLIKVKLPFAVEYYEEPLVDIESLVVEFTKKNFELRQCGSCVHFLSTYTKPLSSIDKEYIKLFHYVSLWKKPLV